jgi:DNA-binding GntR family transcriptional regulator
MTTAEPADAQDVSLVARTLSSIRKSILSGEYAPGSWLRLNKLTSETGASLIPVREALRILETERLVESIPNRGARVLPLSASDMNDLYAVRTILEVEAIRISPPLDDATRAEMQDVLGLIQVAVAEADRDEVIRLNREFHFALYRRSGSPWLVYLIEMLWNHNERYQRMSLHFRHDAADVEHRAIVDALTAGDSVAAAEALRTHLQTTIAGIAEAFELAPT